MKIHLNKTPRFEKYLEIKHKKKKKKTTTARDWGGGCRNRKKYENREKSHVSERKR